MSLRNADLPKRIVSAVVMLAAAALAVGLSTAFPHAVGFTLVAIGYGLLTFAIVVTGVRLQDAVTGPARATVTSVADVGADLTAMATFALCGLTLHWFSTPTLIAAFAVPLLALAIAGSRGSSPRPV